MKDVIKDLVVGYSVYVVHRFVVKTDKGNFMFDLKVVDLAVILFVIINYTTKEAAAISNVIFVPYVLD